MKANFIKSINAVSLGRLSACARKEAHQINI